MAHLIRRLAAEESVELTEKERQTLYASVWGKLHPATAPRAARRRGARAKQLWERLAGGRGALAPAAAVLAVVAVVGIGLGGGENNTTHLRPGGAEVAETVAELGDTRGVSDTGVADAFMLDSDEGSQMTTFEADAEAPGCGDHEKPAAGETEADVANTTTSTETTLPAEPHSAETTVPTEGAEKTVDGEGDSMDGEGGSMDGEGESTESEVGGGDSYPGCDRLP